MDTLNSRTLSSMASHIEKQALFNAIGKAISSKVAPWAAKHLPTLGPPMARIGKEAWGSGVVFPAVTAPFIAGAGIWGAVKNAPKPMVE